MFTIGLAEAGEQHIQRTLADPTNKRGQKVGGSWRLETVGKERNRIVL